KPGTIFPGPEHLTGIPFLKTVGTRVVEIPEMEGKQSTGPAPAVQQTRQTGFDLSRHLSRNPFLQSQVPLMVQGDIIATVHTWYNLRDLTRKIRGDQMLQNCTLKLEILR